MMVRSEAALADPLVDIRDVVETVRSYRIVPPDWRGSLEHASTVLGQVTSTESALAKDTSRLLGHVRYLLEHDLASDPKRLEEIGRLVAGLLEEVRVPGLPLPTDEHWEFTEDRGDTT